jgi:hypothetical protein
MNAAGTPDRVAGAARRGLVAVLVGALLGSLAPTEAARADRWEVRREVREGAREVEREKREARREIRRCKTRECARREIREGYREVEREKREARREIRREIRENRWDERDPRDRYDGGDDVLKGVVIGAAVVGVAVAVARSDD